MANAPAPGTPDTPGAAVPAALAARLMALYPVLAESPPPQWLEALPTLPHAQVPAGTVLFSEGAPCQGFPLVLNGEVRVARGTPDGRSLELYRVTPGEVCVVSASCLFGPGPDAAGSPSPSAAAAATAATTAGTLSAHGVATQPTELLLLTPGVFLRWCAHEPFRRFVFGVFAARLADLMALAEAVAFQRLDQRLAAALLGRGNTLRLTHQQLADELGTVREMVTRLLKRFERAGWVRLGRERVELADPAALRACAAGAAAAPATPPAPPQDPLCDSGH